MEVSREMMASKALDTDDCSLSSFFNFETKMGSERVSNFLVADILQTKTEEKRNASLFIGRSTTRSTDSFFSGTSLEGYLSYIQDEYCSKSQDLEQSPFEEVQPRKRRDDAARVLQKFFCQSYQKLQQFDREQAILQEKILAIKSQKKRELKEIDDLKIYQLKKIQEEFRLELLLAAQDAQMVQNTDEMDGLNRDIKEMKKDNAFLQRRCTSLKRQNKELWNTCKQQEHMNQELSQDIKDMKEDIIQGQRSLGSDEQEVSEATFSYKSLETELQQERTSNKELRGCMNSIIYQVECRLPDSHEKWDLVDLLYQMQRYTRWKSRCNASIRSR